MRPDAEPDGEAENDTRRGRSRSHRAAGLPGTAHEEHDDGPDRDRLDVPPVPGERNEDADD